MYCAEERPVPGPRKIEVVKMSFYDLPDRFETGYIDMAIIPYADSLKGWHEIADVDVMKYVLELNDAGKVKYMGISSHGLVAVLEAVSGLIEVLMFSVNPCYDLLPTDEDYEVI